MGQKQLGIGYYLVELKIFFIFLNEFLVKPIQMMLMAAYFGVDINSDAYEKIEQFMTILVYFIFPAVDFIQAVSFLYLFSQFDNQKSKSAKEP